MNEGATLYLVSACGSAEEFVAAFRRYADRTGLFIPSSAPLPAGRRGRLALTLKDGGVMIEGVAEILQSSTKPTVLYGRPGMTVKFIAPDDQSKIVIGELEKARLAMKPAPPSVPPRPAEIPAEPRPVVPAVGGRIDAANSLAECVVIGDVAELRDTSAPAATPRAHSDSLSGKKFVVPLIPGAPGERPRTPSTPPDASRPKTPSTPPELSARPRTTTTPPDPASKPVPVPTNLPPSKPLSSAASSKMTSIGFPIVDKLPAAVAPVVPVEPAPPSVPAAAAAKGARPSKYGGSDENPLLKTMPGVAMPVNATTQMSAQSVIVADEEATTIGEIPEHVARTRQDMAAESEPTNLSAPPPAPSAGIPTAIGAAPASNVASKASPAPANATGKAASGASTSASSAAPNAAASKTPSGATSAAPTAVVGRSPSGATSAAPTTDASNAPSGAMPAAPHAVVGRTASGAMPAASSTAASKTTSAAPTAVVGSPSGATASSATPVAVASTTPSGATAAGPSTEGAPPPSEPVGILAPPPPPAPAPAPPRAPAAPLPSLQATSTKHQQNKTSIGFPVVRTPFETQPLGLVPPADPQAPIVPKTDSARTPSAPVARGKNPTRPPMVPRQPTPAAPVPVVLRSPSKNAPAPVVEDEATEANAQPPSAPPSHGETAVAHAAYTEAAKAADAVATTRSGGMRASEILAAIPNADWTMAPDASKPTVVPSTGWQPAIPEPTPAPSEIPKGPPTGNWTISIDPEAPEAGWSAPAKVPPSPPPPRAKGGNPDMAVSSDKPITAQAWEDKPTSLGEAKIEIDPTLMQPLDPMPADDEDADGAAVPVAAGTGFDISGPSPFAAPPPSARAGTEPLAGIAALGAVMRAPSAPQPLVGSRPQSGSTPIVNEPPPPPPGSTGSFASAPAYSIPPAALPHTPAQMFEPGSPAAMFGFPQAGEAAAAAQRRKKFLIIGAAVLAVAAGFAVVLLVTGGKKSTSAGKTPAQGSAEVPKTVPDVGSAEAAPAVMPVVDAAAAASDETADTPQTPETGSGSAAVAVEPAGGNAAPEPPPANDGMCTVSVASVPTGADIVIAKEKRGTTPADVEVPCGKAVTIAVRKPKFDTADREITPKAGKPAKLTLKLPKPSVMVKVTSTPMGATITVGGKSMGVTPAKIRMTIGEPASVVLSKQGYAPDTTKITPKGNAPAINATLKKKR